MCGIFGMSAKKGKKVNLQKMKILGLYNIQRGEHSSGYYWNGNVAKGVDANKNWGDWIVKEPILKGTLEGEIFMGHTRKATNGVHNEFNAHPHVIENEYVQTHNGTICNMPAMCRKYEIDTKGLGIDSHMLATVIKQRGFDVLNYYDGYAALSMVFMSDCKSLYLYHGACKASGVSKENSEERPMFILETEDALYYSSMESSLRFISDGKAVPYVLPHNIVHKIVEGVIVEQVYTVHRDDANIYIAPKPKEKEIDCFSEKLKKKYEKMMNRGGKVLPFNADETPPRIWSETYPMEHYGVDKVYFRWGRFFRSGFKENENILLNGVYCINREGIILKENNILDKGSKIETFYFVRGAMMRDQKAYDSLLAAHPHILTDDVSNICFYMSKHSRYPLSCMPGEANDLHESFRKMWFKDGVKFNGQFNVKFSLRKYNIENGRLASVIRAFDGEDIFNDKTTTDNTYIIDGFEPQPVVVSGFKVNEQGDLFKEDKSLLPAKKSIGWPFTENWKKQNIELYDSEGQLIEMEILEKEQEQDQKSLEEQFIINNIASMVLQWCDVLLSIENVKTIPETFLLFVDWVIRKIHKEEKNIYNMTEEIVQQFTTDYLYDMMQCSTTLRESLSGEKKYKDLCDYTHVIKCLSEYWAEELAVMQNRYMFISFVPQPNEEEKQELKTFDELIEKFGEKEDQPSLEIDFVEKSIIRTNANNETRERCKLLVDQLKDLVKTADSFQELEHSDSAQEIAFTLYNEVGELKRKVQEISKQHNYIDIVEELVKIK